jgi:hypothetical protein
MTFLATIVIFAAALSLIWLATQRTGRQHECSCARSRRVLAEYERIHNPEQRDRPPVLIRRIAKQSSGSPSDSE